MKTTLSRKSSLLSLSLLFILTIFPFSSAMAGNVGTLVYAPAAAPAAIPSLSGTMLIVLCLLLVAVSFRIAKQKNSGTNHFVIALLGAGALISAGGGMKLISDAHALTTHTMVAGGGSLPVFNNDLNTYSNRSGVDQVINSINLPPPNGTTCPNTNPPGPGLTRCNVNDTVVNGGSCSINCVGMYEEVSDIRLKRNIKFLTELENGIKLYSFKYNWSEVTYVGVMAQDMLKDVVYKNSVVLKKNNYYAVNYKALGLKMITLDQWLKSPKNILNISKM